MNIVYERVAYSYPSKAALKGVSCEIKSGTLALLVGHNGSGKSTFLKLMNGILKPASGEVRLGGASNNGKSVGELARLCALSFQNPDDQLFASTVLGELKFGNDNIGGDGALIGKVAGLLRLEDSLKLNPLSLTYSLRRLVTIGGSAAMNTPILALDEPTAGLSKREKSFLGDLLLHEKKLGKTIVIVTHDLNFLLPFADALLMLSHGRLVYFGSRDELFEREDARSLMAECGIRYPVLPRMSEVLDAGRNNYDAEGLLEELLKRKAGATRRTNGQHQLEGAKTSPPAD